MLLHQKYPAFEATVHRSGWNDVILTHRKSCFEHLKHPTYNVDDCIERTFLTHRQHLHQLQKLPYRLPWIGIAHHAFSTDYAPEHSANEILQTPLFILSLDCCVAIVCLSNDLRENYRKHLPSHVRVVNVVHPISNALSFASLWNPNGVSDYPVVHIGFWYRNPWAFELLDCGHRKKFWVHYQPKRHASLVEFFNHLLPVQDQEATPKGRIMTLDKLRNKDYDTLLSHCIVFVWFVHASASNTVLECIRQGTPIVCNRLPSLIEYLGEDYVGFCDNIQEDACQLLQSSEQLIKAHEQLLLRRSFITHETFSRQWKANNF